MARRWVTYYQQTRAPFGGALPAPPGNPLVQGEHLRPFDYRRLVNALGAAVRDPDHAKLDERALGQFLVADGTQTFVLRLGHDVKGLCQATRAGWDDVEISNFGLVRSLGANRALLGYLLDQSVRAIWPNRPRRVSVAAPEGTAPELVGGIEDAGFVIFDRRQVEVSE